MPERRFPPPQIKSRLPGFGISVNIKSSAVGPLYLLSNFIRSRATTHIKFAQRRNLLFEVCLIARIRSDEHFQLLTSDRGAKIWLRSAPPYPLANFVIKSAVLHSAVWARCERPTMDAYVPLGAASLAIASTLLTSSGFAQTPSSKEPTSSSVTIAIANKFQQVVPATDTERRTLTIKNDNSDKCWVFIGSGKSSKENSIALASGETYVRYWPLAPSDAIQATCASSSDTLEVEYQ
jgi:hypothetical protein